MALSIYRCRFKFDQMTRGSARKGAYFILYLLYFLIPFCSCRLLAVGSLEQVLNGWLYLSVSVSCQVQTVDGPVLLLVIAVVDS
jgi:hypothetical protein